MSFRAPQASPESRTAAPYERVETLPLTMRKALRLWIPGSASRPRNDKVGYAYRAIAPTSGPSGRLMSERPRFGA